MTLDEKLRLVFGYSDQALTEVAKVPDETVSPELKSYIVAHAGQGIGSDSSPAFRASAFPTRRRPTHRSASATA